MREKLFIYPESDTKLPDDFVFSHNICVRLYDQLVELLLNENFREKTNVEVDLNEGQLDDFTNSENVLDWLKELDLMQDRQEIISRNLVLALASDVCHFIYQALDSAKNMKLTVAFTLIRKPFLENLSILEQLLVKEERFIQLFGENPNKFEPTKLAKEGNVDIIKECIKKIEGYSALHADILYELRWDKSNPNSIYANTNLATHLVTTRNSSYRTDSLNLNLIFSNNEDWEDQLQYFYYYVPYLLTYLLEVVDTYFFEKEIMDKDMLIERKFLRMISQMFMVGQSDEEAVGRKALLTIANKIKVKCSSCEKLNSLYFSDFFGVIQFDYILCKHCLADLLRETDSMKDAMATVVGMRDTEEE